MMWLGQFGTYFTRSRQLGENLIVCEHRRPADLRV